jgi:fibro-slime domain-containing protein
MKKFQSFSTATLLIVSLLTGAAGFININVRTAEAGAPIQLYYSSMEAPTFGPTYWSEWETEWQQTASDEYCDDKSANITDDTGTNPDFIVTTGINTVGYNNLNLSFWYKITKSLESGDYIKVQWSSNNGSTWNDIQTYTNTGIVGWTQASLNLSSGVEGKSNLKLRFLANLIDNDVSHCGQPGHPACDPGDGFRLDCIRLVGNPVCVQTNGGVEACDNVDNDCDGSIDENLTQPTICGVGICSGNQGIEACTAGNWGGNTCNPLNGATTEICEGSLDENCDGAVDEGCDCTNGDQDSCGTTDVGVCAYGTQTCADGQWGSCVGNIEPGTESCNGLDDDCDDAIDEDYNIGQTCAVGIGLCETAGQNVCTQDGTSVECSATPGQPGTETCDGLDNDCDGETDEGDVCAPACITEGNSGAVIPGQICCEGLDPIGTGAPDQSGNCPEPPPVGAFICTMCGNGTCGLGENKCNCPEDCGTPGYCGMYFDQLPYPDNMDFQKPGQIFGLNPGDSPFNHPTWWDIAKLVFTQTDSSLAFGNNFFPVDPGLYGNKFYFTAKWQAKLIVPADGNYNYTLRSDDDSWLYIDSVMEQDLGGVHDASITRNDSIYLTQGEHTLNLYFAERHTTQSYLDFHWTTSGIETIADCEEYCGDQSCNGNENCETCATDCGTCPVATCGDGIVNQTSEECDGQAGVPEHYTCTTECTLEYVPYCGDQICDNDETCISCVGDCGLCPCDPNQELVINGGFETPEVTHTALWDIFNNSNGLTGWSMQWESLQAVFNEIARPVVALLELQKGVAGDPEEGLQLAELDADWFGPDNPMNGEPASVRIYQDILTVPGRQYAVSFWFSPRPNTALTENKLEFAWDWGNFIDNTIEGAGENNTTWVEKEYTLTATSAITRIQFADLGTPDSLGTYLDDVSIRCIPESTCDSSPEICSDKIDNDCDGLIDCVDSDCAQDLNCIQVGCEPGAKEACETGLYGICAAGTRTCGERAVWGECVQNNQPAEEICDQIDNDCDNAIDEDLICTGRISTVITGGGGGGGGHLVVCGDGTREYTEMCDDGNIIDGDGCSSTCGVEVVLGASTQQGEVLGESTTLPQTGEDAMMLIISSIVIAFGAGFGLKKKLSV